MSEREYRIRKVYIDTLRKAEKRKYDKRKEETLPIATLRYARWTDVDKAKVLSNHTVKEIAIEIGRTHAGVKRMRVKLRKLENE